MDTVIGLFVSSSGALLARLSGGRCRAATPWETRAVRAGKVQAHRG
jgi:hypothetical protein